MNALSAWASRSLVPVQVTKSVGVRMLPMMLVTAAFVLMRGRDRIDWLGILLLGWGAVACVVDLLQMLEDGRLDQIRLSGRPPTAFLAAFAAATAGPWAALGLIVIAAGRLQGATSHSLSETAAIVGFLLVVIVGALRIGLEQSRVDPRLVIAVLIAGAMAIAVTGESAMESLRQLRAATAPFLIAIEAAVIIWVARPLVGLIARPAGGPVDASWGARLPQRQWMLRMPGFFRGVTVAFNGVVLLMVFAPLVIFVRLFMAAPAADRETAFLYIGPLIIGVVTVSILCREDAMSWRLEIIRQSAMTPWRTGLQMAVGLWAPFVLVSLLLVLLTWALFFVTAPGALATVVVLMLVAPLPIVEGWSRYWPLTYMVPFLALTPFLRGGWAAPLVLSALHWYAMPRKFANPDAPVLRGWYAVAGASAVAGALGLTPARMGPGGVGMAMMLSLVAISPVLIDRSATRAQRWAGPIAVGLAGGTMASIGNGVSAGMAIALAAALAWMGASRIPIALAGRPAAQAMTRLIVLAIAITIVVVFDLAGWADVVNPWLLVAMGAGIFAAAEIASRAAALMGRADERPLTPPA